MSYLFLFRCPPSYFGRGNCNWFYNWSCTIFREQVKSLGVGPRHGYQACNEIFTFLKRIQWFWYSVNMTQSPNIVLNKRWIWEFHEQCWFRKAFINRISFTFMWVSLHWYSLFLNNYLQLLAKSFHENLLPILCTSDVCYNRQWLAVRYHNLQKNVWPEEGSQ